MNSLHAGNKLKQEIWPDFIAHFQNDISIASYLSDISEFMNLYKIDFLQLSQKEVSHYYARLQKKVEAGELQPATMAKKFRELHSFANYICDHREQYEIPEAFEDYFYPYLRAVVKQEKYAKTIPMEHIDKLLKAAQKDLMAYCILVFLQRVGLSSTEITKLKVENFAAYDNGVYVSVSGRNELCFIPEDVFVILERYLSKRDGHDYLFYNSRGNQLNTMYISRMMDKYTKLANVPSYSAQALRNSCAYTMFSYDASPEQVARQMGVTQIQIKRYKNMAYREDMLRAANHLVKIKIEPPQ